jgi:iron complex outermembrane receptor protein
VGASPAASGAARDTLYVVAPIVVSAPRADARARLFDRAGFVALVDLTGRRDRVEDLAHVLSTQVGVRVKQYGGLGSFATVSIRGSSSSQVSVYLDGIPVNDPYLGPANLADLPLGGATRVEVFRGFAPPYLGSSAIGGAINLVTDEAPAAWRAGPVPIEASASYGSFETTRQLLTARLTRGALRLRAHGGHAKSLGGFSFFDDNGTEFEPDDDSTSVRANNDFEAWNALARLDARTGGAGTFTLAYDFMTRAQGVPGVGANQSLTARAERERHLGYLRFEGAPLFGQLTLSGTGFASRAHERFTDLDDDIALVAQATDNTITVTGGRARARWLVPSLPVVLDAVYHGRKEHFHPTQALPTPTAGPDRWRRASTTALTGELYLFGERVLLTATQRWERHEGEFYDPPRFPWFPPTPTGKVTGSARAPSAGLRARVTQWLTLKGNAGRYYRLPTFVELFGNTGSVTGNPDLEPEEGENRDVGAVVSMRRAAFVDDVFVELSYHDNSVANLILFFPNSQYASKPRNIGAARIRGWESSAAFTVAGRARASVSWTRLDTEDTSDITSYNGKALPSRPRDEVAVSLGTRLRAWRVTYEYHTIGANFLDRYNQKAVPARHLHSAIVAWDLPVTGLALTIEGRNLTDDRVSDVGGFPLPGRSFYTTLGYRR